LAIRTRRGAGRPTKEGAAEIADRVLDGAKRTFCRQGISGALMDEIAIEAGVTKHTIYRRYPRKTALLEAVVERELVRFTQWMEAPARQESDPLDMLKHAASRFADYGARPENVTFTFFLLAESAFCPEMFERFLRWEKLAVRPLLEKIIIAQAAGRLLPGDPRDICDILRGLIDGFSHSLRRPGSQDGANAWKEQFEARWAIFLRALGRAESLSLDRTRRDAMPIGTAA